MHDLGIPHIELETSAAHREEIYERGGQEILPFISCFDNRSQLDRTFDPVFNTRAACSSLPPVRVERPREPCTRFSERRNRTTPVAV
jgi:hypothetical protein